MIHPSPIRRAIVCCDRNDKFFVEIRGEAILFICESCGTIFAVIGKNMFLQQRRLEPDGSHTVLSQEYVSTP